MNERERASTVLLVGASGRVGRLISSAWGAPPRWPRLLRQYRSGATGGDSVIWSPLEGSGALCEASRERPIDEMIVFAGVVRETAGRSFADEPRIADACLSAAHDAGIGRCLVASSAAVYGPSRATPYEERDRAAPTTPYGAAKLLTEEVCAAWAARGLAVTALRIGNVAGADALLGQPAAAERREIVLDRFDDGAGPERSYIDPFTLADVLASLLAEEESPPVLNVGAPGAVAMADLLDAADLAWSWRPAPPAALRRLVLECGRLAAIHQFRPDAADPGTIVAQWRKACGL